MDEGLVRFAAAAGEAAEAGEQARVNTNGDQLFGVAGFWPSDAAGALELRVGGFRNVGEINAAWRNTPCAPCGWRGGR